MNFFERQTAARKSSNRLVFLFLAAILSTAALFSLALLIASGGEAGFESLVFGALLAGGTMLAAYLFKVAQLGSGGAQVAQQMGGSRVSEDTQDFHLQRLRNVVEEVAIASGVPVPEIYVLEHEAGINAFAAGYSTADAAVAVTRGALDRLNREELQGVIAHEFSHILNGDMRLNIRLMGGLFGIMVLALIGRKILMHGRLGRNKNVAGIMIMALALVVVGYIGVFFGRLIKAGVSRQREYLADASAVQFTRQTSGLSGALKKIGGLSDGAKIKAADAEEVSHMLFGEGVGLSGWMSTHPPLLDRIRALEPSFTADKLDVLRHQWEISPPNGIKEDLAMGLSASSGDLPAAQAELRLVPPAVVAQVATPQSNDYSRAGQIVKQIPDSLYRAAHDRSAAPSLIFGLLFSESSKIRQQQFLELKARIGGEAAQHAVDYADRLQTLHPMLRLPLAELALPVMRRRPRPELEGFAEMIYALTHADGKVSLFEYCLGALVRRHVFEMLDPSRTHKVGNKRVSQLSKEVVSLLSVLAQAGHTDAIKAQHAFLAGIACLFPREAIAYMVPRDPIALLDSALNELDALQPESKSLLIEAMVVSISHDGCVSVAEAELLRTICAALHCPLPPMLEQVPQH